MRAGARSLFTCVVFLLAFGSLCFAQSAQNAGTQAPTTSPQQVVEEASQSAGEITKEIMTGVKEHAKKTMEIEIYCEENPADPKCVARRKAKMAEDEGSVEDALKTLDALSKDPNLGPVVQKRIQEAGESAGQPADEMAKREKFLKIINDMCKDPSSEACKIAKQDYEDWKAGGKASAK